MSWINDAANRAKEEDEDRKQRDEAFWEQSQQLWGGLMTWLQEDVQKINENQELLTRRLGGDKLRVGGIQDGIEVKKLVFPAMYLRVRFNGQRIEVEREIVTNGGLRRTRTEREQINFDIDSEYQVSLKNDSGERLNIPEASQYLLTPLLNTHTIE